MLNKILTNKILYIYICDIYVTYPIGDIYMVWYLLHDIYACAYIYTYYIFPNEDRSDNVMQRGNNGL